MYHKVVSTTLGEDGLTKFNVTTILDMLDIVSAVKSPLPIPLQDLLNVYSDFKSDLGYYITITAKLFLPDSKESKFCKSHNPSFVLKPGASGELDRLEK